MASIDRGNPGKAMGHGARNMAVGSASPRLALATGGQDACGRRLTHRLRDAGGGWNVAQTDKNIRGPGTESMTMCFEKDDLGLDRKCLEITPDFCQRPSCAH